MIYKNKKYYFINKQNKFFILAQGNEYNEYNTIRDSFNENIVLKYIKDNKIKVFEKVNI